ncbi:MAG TPA: hypothetical protein VGD58_17340 [Herpetosiphonaceae bacterium]
MRSDEDGTITRDRTRLAMHVHTSTGGMYTLADQRALAQHAVPG